MKSPGNQSPGGSRRSAAYSKSFAAGTGAGQDLTNQISQAQGATSGFYCIATATTVQLKYTDTAGNVVDTGSLTAVVGNVWDLSNIAATVLTLNTGLLLIAYWHPNGTS